MFRIFSAVALFTIGYLIGVGAISVDADLAGPAIMQAVDYVTVVVTDVYDKFASGADV
jgi:hypothetical protein